MSVSEREQMKKKSRIYGIQQNDGSTINTDGINNKKKRQTESRVWFSSCLHPSNGGVVLDDVFDSFFPDVLRLLMADCVKYV